MTQLSHLVKDLQLELLLQLLLAVFLGGAIGLERELRGKPAGLRTNILICVGATLYTHLSYIFSGPGGDSGRIAAQILTGVGFIGAGTIIHEHGAVTGLTSAATIWVVSAIGMALGARAYLEALGTTALVAVVLEGLRFVERAVGRWSTHSRLVVHLKPEAAAASDVEAILRKVGLEIEHSESQREKDDLVLELIVRGPRRFHEQATVALLHHHAVRAVRQGE